jgi:uncharacterized protein (TIGR03437 family)
MNLTMKITYRFLPVLMFAAVVHGQTIQSVLNAASYSTAVAPFTWVAIFGTQLASSETPAASIPFPTTLGGVSVTFNGVSAPLSYVSPGQVNALVPVEAATLSGSQTAMVAVIVTTAAGPSPVFNLTLQSAAPAIFADTAGNALVFDANFEQITTLGSAPFVLYATGLGPTNPPAATNALGALTAPLNQVLNSLTASIAGSNASTVLWSGLAPGLHGIYQVNIAPVAGPLGNSFSLSDTSAGSTFVSDNVMLPVPQGANVANLTGSIDGLYPASGAAATTYGGPTSAPVSISAFPLSGTFSATFDILSDAEPFTIEAVAGVANVSATAVVTINPGQNSWQATYTVPNATARQWNFTGDGFTVLDLLNNGPFPANVVPPSRLDPAAVSALSLLPLPTTAPAGIANGAWTASGTLPANGHVSLSDVVRASGFGAFGNLTVHGTQTAVFTLWVDNVLVATKSVPFAVD